MPRRRPEKTRHVRPRRVHKREKKYNPLPFQESPVKVGQEVEVTIDDIGSRGDGITRIQSFIIFVPETKVGEHLKVKIVSVGRKFAIAEKINETGGKNSEN